MEHYVAYHNIDSFGSPNLEESRFEHPCRKPLSFLRRTLGQSVWVITGNKKRGRGGTRFRLVAVFLPDKATRGSVSGPLHSFEYPLELNQLVWFRSLLSEQGHFRFGLKRTFEATAIKNFIGTRDGIPRRKQKRGRSRANRYSHTIDYSAILTLLRQTPPHKPTRYSEGTPKYVVLTAYERNPIARKACLAHYGYRCTVCGFDFRAFYGELGRSCVHVHHLVDIATIGRRHEVDPIKDLRPVCPNCHAALHSETPTMAIETLQARLKVMSQEWSPRRGHPQQKVQ